VRTKPILKWVGRSEKPEPILNPADVLIQEWTKDLSLLPTDKGVDLTLLTTLRTAPNPLFSDMERDRNGLYIPTRFTLNNDMRFPMYTYQEKLLEKKPEPPIKETFEVNLTEPLVGWRTWRYLAPINNSRFHLSSIGVGIWRPLEAIKAICQQCEDIPNTFHTCGIYAVDKRENLPTLEGIVGEVYGWGRYVRGSEGWRCQYAYPKAFYLNSTQAHLARYLREFRVPIYVDVPMLRYDPREDGYTDANRNDQANWDFGTCVQPNSTENQDSEPIEENE